MFGGLLWGSWARLPTTVALLTTALVLLLAAGFLPLLTTVLTAEGLSQMTFRGRVEIRWRDVRGVKLGHRGRVDLESINGTRARVSAIFYNDFDATLQWLADRLTPVWPADDS
jgi:hypothetical protein